MPRACRLSSAEIARAASSDKWIVLASALACVLVPAPARAMHLADGILPLGWAALWWGVAAGFAAVGLLASRVAATPPQEGPSLVVIGEVVSLRERTAGGTVAAGGAP